jgi:lipoprotein-anchoring transpeptidase ErfK/SrfK
MRMVYALCIALLMSAIYSPTAHAQLVLERAYPFFANPGHAERLPQNQRFVRATVPYDTEEAPGTIIIDSRHFYLYFIEGNGVAIRYGVGVGRVGFGWHGTAHIRRMVRWPTWTPTPRMVREDPAAADWRTGMPGGLGNPLGARALYLFEDAGDALFNSSGVRLPIKGDTQYRIHGTWEPSTIGTNVSSGCIRMNNDDVADLFARVKLGAKVVVR